MVVEAGVDVAPGPVVTGPTQSEPNYGKAVYQAAHDARNSPFYGLGVTPVHVPNHPPLARGQIVQKQPIGKEALLGLKFLFNPTQVEHDLQVNSAVLPPSAQSVGKGNGAAAAALTPGGASITFDLILDRTYECWKDPTNLGVMADVNQLNKMVGYSAKEPFMEQVGFFVFFGDPNDARIGKQNVLWYYGWLTAFSYIYTNWTQYMVPYRAAISGLTLTVVADNLTRAQARKAATAFAGTADLETIASGGAGGQTRDGGT
jgi:hypothetical protein